MAINTQQNPAGNELSLQFNVIENVFEGVDQCKAELELTNGSQVVLGYNWSIYFNFVRQIIPESVTPAFRILHINGDFFCLTPGESYQAVAPGSKISISFVAKYWVTKKTDTPVGFYIVYRDSQGHEGLPESIPDVSFTPFLQQAQVVRSANDLLQVPTAASRFIQYQDSFLLPKDKLTPILPTPVFCQKSDGFFHLRDHHVIACSDHIITEVAYLNELLFVCLGKHLKIVNGNKGDIRLGIGIDTVDDLPANGLNEGYSLVINETGIEINGESAAGLFYGIQSLQKLIAPGNSKGNEGILPLPFIEVKDAPVFKYRGLHLDVARNFQPVKSILRLLDLMASYKLNTFHFHLTDDEGWRLEIPGLPELTAIGGRRGHPGEEKDCLLPSFGSGPDPEDPTSSGNGFYSREEFISILQYAHNRHIRVIPEIDLPGHARAAILAMEVRNKYYQSIGDTQKAVEYLLTDVEDQSVYESVQMWNDNVLNIGLESTYHFIAKVVDELIDMFAAAKAPLTVLHIGGDEVPMGVWTKSPIIHQLKAKYPDLQNDQDLFDYFVKRVNQLLHSKGLITAGWEELALTNTAGSHQPNPAFLQRGVIPYVWNTIWGGGGEAIAYDLANAGYQVVLANATHLYFDLAYDKDPEEPGYYWAGYIDTKTVFKYLPFDIYQSAETDVMGKPIDARKDYKEFTRLTEKGRHNILGVQGHLWGENIRDNRQLEYLLLPRMLALAERAWANLNDPIQSNKDFQQDWNEFANRIGQLELPGLDILYPGIHYRIPLPGAVIKEGVLMVNMEFPGLEVRFTTDGSDPTVDSMLYESPTPVESNNIKLRTFTSTGRSSRTCVL